MTCPPPKATLEMIDALPAGPLDARWASPDLVEVRKAGQPIVHLLVTRADRRQDTYIKLLGNTKTRFEVPILNSLSLGCLRRATGYERCDRTCYEDDQGRGGCYASANQYAIQRASVADHYDIVHNAILNDQLLVRLPSDGLAVLPDADLPVEKRSPIIRSSSESSDASFDLALGITQAWAEGNPDRWFLTLCSHHFRLSDAMLCWAAALGNVIGCTTVSGWLSAAELDDRFAAARRFQEFGLPTVIWLVTSRDWANELVLERALELVPPELVVEVPHRSSHHAQELPLFSDRGVSVCGSMRYDADGRRVEFHQGADGTLSRTVRGADGAPTKPRGQVHSRCLNCPTKCGWTALFGHGFGEAPALRRAA